MSNYFDIIISINDFIKYSKPLIIEYNIHIYLEKWNEQKLFYYEEVKDFDLAMNHEYRGVFLSSKKVDFQNVASFYDDKLSKHTIEVKGGRESDNEIELIKLRILSKDPNKVIKLFYNQLQTAVKKDSRFGKGVKWGNHSYDKIYYDKTIINKKVWGDFSKKHYEIIIPN